MLQPPKQSKFHQEDIDSSQFTAKKSTSRLKKSNLRSMLPPIQMPQSKRAVHEAQGQTRIPKKKMVQISSPTSVLKPLLNNLFQSLEEKQQQAKVKKKIKFDIFKILQNEKDLPVGRVKRYLTIANILSYLYNESEKTQGIQNIDLSLPKYKVYSQWQLLQIQQNYKDTNLGDFIIKMVNPDLLPQDYKKKKDIGDDKTHENWEIDMFQALRKYDQLFNTEEIVDKNLEDAEKQAFQLAYFLLEIEKSKLGKHLKTNMDRIGTQFMKTFDYFIKIEPLNYVQYVELKKDSVDFKEMESHLEEKITVLRSTLQKQYKQAKFEKGLIEFQFNKYKIKIYEHLRKRLLKYKVFGKNKEIIGQKQYKEQFKEDHKIFLFCLLKSTKSLSKLLKFFPELTHMLMEEVAFQVDKVREKPLPRQLFAGGYLSRVSHEGELKWILNQKRPQDVLTLVRKFMIYRLNCRGGLFIRSFLSKQQTHIFLVVKASQQHLQKMAQQSSFNMQIQLGAVDIFSFEPVDKYGRPLRCNSYIRDVGFIKKYNLAENKQDKDQQLGQKSVQSQGLNFYKKALDMNEQQLRAKIILDQQQCDKCFSWLSNKVNTRFVQPNQILNNELNEDQIQSDIWPIYYVYNKLVTQYLKRLRQQFDVQKHQKKKDSTLFKNIGLTLRLMFLKALNYCNDLYFDHRSTFFFRRCSNIFKRKYPLQTIWNLMGQDTPRGYFPYSSSKRLDQIWRKYQINQQKNRSKFSPAARLIMTNKIIRQYVNISQSLIQDLIIDFYPIHDPFILKNIKLRPYLNVINSLIDTTAVKMNNDEVMQMNENFVEYQCQYTKEDFTKESMESKLRFRCGDMTKFSVNSVAFYCGEKLAFFFEFRRFLTQYSWPLSIVCFIVQIIFWVENSHLQQIGSSTLTSVNNVLMIILVIINTFWTEITLAAWQNHEKKLARSFGTNQLNLQGQSQKRVLFQGQMKRNLQTNEMNDQHEQQIVAGIKQVITFFINVIFVVLMAATILIIFTLKGQLYQLGYPQSSITTIPSILISISIQIYNFVYSKIIGVLVEFQNKKTVHQYENSLISKSFIVTFVVTYFCLFIYAFFQQYFEGGTVCSIKVATGTEITNCYYYLSSQLVTSVLIQFAVTIVMAFKPLGMFFFTRYQTEHSEKQNITLNLNYFESIDTFYEEQDKMQTYMYSDEIDSTWQGYTAVVISFTTLAFFAPIVPFLYVMMFLNGVVTLNAKKFEIIYFSKRTLPIKTKSIGSWLTIIKIVSVIAVFVNVGLVIFVRQAITKDAAIVYFSCVFVILGFKYVMSFADKDEDIVGKRCKVKTEEIVTEKAYMNYSVKTDLINTDIENLFYDDRRLRRKLPILKEANIKFR